jgi:hypothetical protein
MKQICVLVLFLVVLGCSKSPSFVGTWSSGLGGALSTYHFRTDGTYTMETLFDGYRAVSEGNYHTEGDKFFLEPRTGDVQGAGPRTEEIKGQLMQGARVTYKMYGPNSFRLGLEDPPLIISKVSPNP